MRSLLSACSTFSASKISLVLRSAVNCGVSSMVRTSCWVMVEAPCFMPPVSSASAARAMPLGSIPPCSRKRASSTDKHGVLQHLGRLCQRHVDAALGAKLRNVHAVSSDHLQRQLGLVIDDAVDGRQVDDGGSSGAGQERGAQRNAQGSGSQAGAENKSGHRMVFKGWGQALGRQVQHCR